MSTAVAQMSYSKAIAFGRLRERYRINKYLTIATGFLLFISLLALVTLRIMIQQTSYSIEGLRQMNLVQDQEIRELKLQYESLLNPEQLRIRAKRELGMVQTKPQQVRQLTIAGTYTR